ncbi:MAG: transaldolase [Acidobacteriota bacterium]
MNSLKALWADHGQAVWLDFIQRSLVEGGGLARLVEEDGVRGVTSNPSIFKNAITGTDEYDEQVDAVLRRYPEATAVEVYEELAVTDIRAAADVLRPVYDASGGSDGFVSLEVAPDLAHDTTGTIADARRLWAWVGRPNLMIKVPATAEGMGAIEALIADGINVNATLMFSMDDYEAVAQAYVRGLGRCSDPSKVASVASFFVSRVDTAVDAQLEAVGTPEALALRGKAAIANACLAYRRFGEIFNGGPTFEALRSRGAQVQRPLWASTSAKNPAYPDVLYVEELVGPQTVNTIPAGTLDAYRDHGSPRNALLEGMETADGVMEGLQTHGIDLKAVTMKLQHDGVAAFAGAFDDLLASLAEKIAAR